MGNRATRLALSAFGLSLAMLCAACATWSEPVSSAAVQAPADAIAPTAAAEAAPAIRPAERVRPRLASAASEDFVCSDGSRLRVGYSEARDTAEMSVNGATPIAMRRTDGASTYRAASLVLRRAGPRVVLGSDETSVVVQSGDTLGRIALRLYGERTRAADIARLNDLANPDLIFAGQILRLPQAQRCRRTHRDEAAAPMGAGAFNVSASLNRRLFTPPSQDVPDQRRIRATSMDPPLN